ncbi:hypothetical protein F2D83_17460 [Salmonella enterica]|nr:hypothetical protein [Salmonella enterica]
MYLHIVPKLFHLMANKCTLKSISIPELDLIIDGESLSVGRPWPNKCVWVGMRKSRKSVNGLILQTDKKLRWFTTRYTWDIENMGLIAYSALFDHGLASKSDQRFASIRSTGNLTFSTAF